MFVSHSVHLNHPVKVVSDAVMSGQHAWFPGTGKKNVASVGVHVAGLPVRKKVTVEFGEPVATTTWAVIPLSWKATFPQQLFPEMAGKVELAPSDRDVTRLTVSGMYEPPLGALGKQLDHALMHNVAEGTVKELAESIAGRLEKILEGK